MLEYLFFRFKANAKRSKEEFNRIISDVKKATHSQDVMHCNLRFNDFTTFWENKISKRLMEYYMCEYRYQSQFKEFQINLKVF